MKKDSFRAVPRPGAPASGTLMPTRVGNFANPAATDPIAPGDRIGRAVFTPRGELLWIYGAAEGGHGGFWRLHAARTGNVLAYRGGNATLEDADVDISSGWTHAPLGDLLLGGNANLPQDAFLVLLDPAIAVLDSVNFVFWVNAFEPMPVLAAYYSQLGSWSPSARSAA